jgi:hypothetical protein
MSSHSSETDGPLIVPTMHTEDMDSPHWQERSVSPTLRSLPAALAPEPRDLRLEMQ